MIVYYSGQQDLKNRPESLFENINLMLSFLDNTIKRNKPDRTFKRVIKKYKMLKINSHFFDSGAFGQLNESLKYQKENRCSRWDYFYTKEFWSYMKKYVLFIKKYKHAIDLYANIDVIGNAELTWRNQRWLEKRGLTPVPVIHYLTDDKLKWLNHYINKGYKIIGLGGLVGNMSREECETWIENCFDFVCNNPQRIPCVKLHGFGVSSFKMITKYPWFSTDSTKWIKVAAFGSIIVPRKINGKYRYKNCPPHLIQVSEKQKEISVRKHYLKLNHKTKREINAWLEHINVPVGSINGKDGVINNRQYRIKANIIYHEKLREHLPDWPWPYYKKTRGSLLW